LPIKLLFFEANWNGFNSVQISFATALEQNNKGFEILRSENQNAFKSIKWINGNVNSNQIIKYQYIDNQIVKSNQYSYVLIQYDLDGIKNTLANASIESFSNEIIVGEVSPNPMDNNGSIKVQSHIKSIYKLNVYNIVGAMILTLDGNIVPGENTINFNLSNLQPGIYYLTMIINQNQFKRNIIIN